MIKSQPTNLRQLNTLADLTVADSAKIV